MATSIYDQVGLLLNLLLVALLVVTAVLALVSGGKKTRPKPRVYTRIECLNCGYMVEREYQKGDYVGRVVGKCPKCGSDLIVTAVYEVRPGEREEERRLLRLVERREQG